MAQRRAQAIEDTIAQAGVALGFGRVAADDIAPFPEAHVLDLQAVGQAPKRPGIGKDDVAHRLVGAQPATENVVPGCIVAGEIRERGAGDHPAVGDDAYPADAKALAQLGDHRLEGGTVGSVAGEDLPSHRPAAAVDGEADDDLQQIRALVAGIPAPPQRAVVLMLAVDVARGGVDADQVEAAREQVAVGEKQLPLQLTAQLGERRHRAVHLVQADGLEARCFDGLQPARALAVRSRRHEPLQGQRERDALDVEAELAVRGQPPEDAGKPLTLPQPAEDQRRPPALRGARRERVAAVHPQVLREPRQAGDQPVELAGGRDLVEPAQRCDHPLAVAPRLAARFDQLQVFVGLVAVAHGLGTNVHAESVRSALGNSTEKR